MCTEIDYGRLQANLQEMYYYAKQQTPNPCRLIPTLTGQAVCCDRSWFYGRWVRWYQDCGEERTAQSGLQKMICLLIKLWRHLFCLGVAVESASLKLERAISHVVRSFEWHICNALKNQLDYRQAYLDLLKEKNADASEMAAYRKELTEASEAFFPFWKLCSLSKYKDHLHLLHAYASELGTPLSMVQEKHFSPLKQTQSLIDLESHTGMPVPILALAKLGHSLELSVKDKQAIQKWIEKLNQVKDHLSMKTFEGALKEVVHIINLDSRFSLSVHFLDYKLEQFECRCELFDQADIRQLRWRAELRHRSVINGKDKDFFIDKKLSPDKAIGDHYQVYSLIGEDRVVKTGKNRFELNVEGWKTADENLHWGFKPVKTFEVDPEGKWMIQERLDQSLKGISWKSQMAKLDPEDEKKALAVASHLFWMRYQDASPKGLSADHLMFDKEGEIKSIRILKKEKFNYKTIAQFIKEVANGNWYLEKYLWEVSGLTEHPIATFCYNIFEYTIRGGKEKIMFTSQAEGYKEDYIHEHVEELCEKVRQLREKVTTFLKERNLYKDDKQMGEWLLRLYKQTSATPWDLNTEKILQLVLETAGSKKQASVSEYDYKKAHQTLIEYNKRAWKNDHK
jgi:hypothetical protein